LYNVYLMFVISVIVGLHTRGVVVQLAYGRLSEGLKTFPKVIIFVTIYNCITSYLY